MRRYGYGLTDVGRKRVSNEDSFLLDDELGLYVVADGMGGHNAGEVASQEAVDAVLGMVRREKHLLEKLDEPDVDHESLRKALRVMESAVQGATYMVFGIAQGDPEQEGMGTTVSALLLRGEYGIMAQVGDSRIYLVRGGKAYQLTEDHTLIAWQLKQGVITKEEAERSPHKNIITRAVGSREYVQVDTHAFLVEKRDGFLLCSDGLHGYLSDEEIGPVMQLGPKRATKHFIEIANERGGKDNITAVAVELE
ncbi:MAG: serine/threonine-protein phosphatase [Myxococcales bacterium]|nr:MAG: serine/threonine-protein phosphatase [Myxococcales bacterium]